MGRPMTNYNTSPLTPSSGFRTMNVSRSNSSLPIANSQLVIRAPNYFIDDFSTKFLHFFNATNSTFNYVNLASGGVPQKFTSLKLDIQFQIPRYHRSAISVHGFVLMSGGIVEHPR